MRKKLIRAARYVAATLRVLSLERELTKHNAAAEFVRAPLVVAAMAERREQIGVLLARARAEWTAFYPPGVRFTWGQA